MQQATRHFITSNVKEFQT